MQENMSFFFKKIFFFLNSIEKANQIMSNRLVFVPLCKLIWLVQVNHDYDNHDIVWKRFLLRLVTKKSIVKIDKVFVTSSFVPWFELKKRKIVAVFFVHDTLWKSLKLKILCFNQDRSSMKTSFLKENVEVVKNNFFFLN